MKKYYLTIPLLLALTMFSSCSYFSSDTSSPDSGIDKDKSVEAINKGLVLQAQKRYDSALESFRLAIELDRFNPEAYFYASYVCFLLKDYEGSYYYARKSTKIDAGYADGYLMASQVLLDRKKYREALALLSRLVAIKPKESNHLYKNQFTVYYRMGICYIGLGQYKNGLDALKKSVSIAAHARNNVPSPLVRSAKDMIRKVERRLH